jgi:hypothetical protein
LALEVQRTTQPERRVFVEAIIERATEFILLDDALRRRGNELRNEDFGPSTPCTSPVRNHRGPSSSARVMIAF